MHSDNSVSLHSKLPTLFFGVGTGRNGTMAIANLLNSEEGVCCAHEGKIRWYENPDKQVLRFLTLENRLAYEKPQDASAIFARVRGAFGEIAIASGSSHFGDIAYNYAPFLHQIETQFPSAKLLVFFRNGIDFVRSATQSAGEDVSPVGWPPADKQLSAVERYVALGRLAPRKSDPLESRWESLDHFARNAWLWSETNRLILEGIADRDDTTTFVIRYEDFFADSVSSYAALRDFLGLDGSSSPQTLQLLRKPINKRAQKVAGPYESWTKLQQDQFKEFAGSMMDRLNYGVPA